MIASFLAAVFLQFLLIEFWSVSSEISRFTIWHELMQSINFDSHWFKVWFVSSEISRFAIWLKKEPNWTQRKISVYSWILISIVRNFKIPSSGPKKHLQLHILEYFGGCILNEFYPGFHTTVLIRVRKLINVYNVCLLLLFM